MRFYSKKFWQSIYILGLFTIISSASFAQDERLNEIILGPGDAIHLSVYDGAFAPVEGKFISIFHDKIFIINGFGQIDMFTLGEIKIAGLTTEEIRVLLTEKLKPYAKEPMIIVRPLIRITLRGEFGQPGMYRFGLDTSFWDMIQQAGGLVGGLDGISALEDMFIMRKEQIIYKDFVEAIHSATSIYELGIESGDEVVVPRANRPTFRSMMRYFQFGMSLIILYLTLLNQS
ncbi:polysaccharide biosynthesis/export family protein [candidate division KSB1 bacterium]|nr:polysaccharide biosynthesis/export family protein [candidate division KSB1 bacterium]